MSKRHRLPASQAHSATESADVTEDLDVTEEAPAASAETVEAPAAEAKTQEAPAAADAETTAVELDETEPADSEEADDSEGSEESEAVEAEPIKEKRKINWPRVLVYGVLPGLALVLALAAGFSKWTLDASNYSAVPPVASEQNPSPALDSMNAAKDSTIKMLSYKPETVAEQLNAARDLLTGEFRESYTALINDVVIPGAQQKKISAVASVPAAAVVSADPKHAVVLVFVNQTVVVGQDAPTDTASSVRVKLDKIDGRWLISEFEPV